MPIARCVLSQYPYGGSATPVTYLGAAGGFSGAELWKLATPQGPQCLRGWPPDLLDPARLAWIHDHLARIIGAGCRIVPGALPTRGGTTWVAHDGRLWDLSPWLRGTANYQQAPTREKLRAALQTLAHFHRCARDGPARRPARGPARSPTTGVSPSLANRRALILELDHGRWQELNRVARSQFSSDLAPRARVILEYYRRYAPDVLRQVRAAERLSAPLQVCHGDLWHDHVLFSGDEVTGLVDFGAMRMDSRALDVARLLGSLVRDEGPLWETGIAAYEQIEPLCVADRALVAVFDRSTVLLSGMNWLKWLLLERRQFECWSRVLQRLDAITVRMSVTH